ncbi:MAG: hypothetical protein M3162_04225 [Thermoproteota archaeon]|nr:hypothetical protein [Thermoproteota archaeon]
MLRVSRHELNIKSKVKVRYTSALSTPLLYLGIQNHVWLVTGWWLFSLDT